MKKFHRFPLYLFVIIWCAACQPATPIPTLEPTLPPTTHTPLPSATATIVPTLTPTLVPTPESPYFTENFDNELSRWAILQAGGADTPQTRLNNGFLVFDLAAPYDWVYAIAGSFTYSDVRVDALMQNQGQDPASLGLICRYSEQDGWFEFNISGDGTYNVLYGQWLDKDVARYTPIAMSDSEYIKKGGVQNEIGLTCQGKYLLLYLNGKLFRKLDVSRFNLNEGKVGLSVSSFENTPVTAAFDWVKVSEP